MFWGRLKLGALYSHLLYYLVILFACQFIYNYLPRETKDPNSPISVKAIHELLKNLTDIGPRVVGSEENEIQTVGFLLSTLESMDKKSLYALEISHQVVSGHLTLPNRHINYRDLQNVVAKLVLSGNPRGPSILFNCHFDTVPLSPGASDDGISCAIMLHLIDIFATKVASSRYHYNLIFLFNGAEESYLPASHGFVKRHPWAQNISMFINLEAAGAGGREMLFQSGPGKPWILETYLKSAPRPGANVFAQELFESGAIPSDTDFRIFRDFGNLSGLDIAFVKNGYVYHTKYDSLKRVSYGSTLRCAENLLAITEALLTIEKNAMETNSSSETSTPVFFDFLGLYAVSYSAETAMLLNIVVAITALVPLCFKFFHMSSFFGHMSPLVAYTCLIYLYRVMGLMISLGVAIGTYKILRLFNATMSWYSSFAKAIPLYGVPYISSMVCVLTCVFWEKNYPPNLTIGLLQLVTQMEFIVMLVAGTLLQIKTTYVIMLFVMFPMIGELIDSLLRKTTRRRYHKWISGLFEQIFLLIPLMNFLYLVVTIANFVIPLMGRVGIRENTEGAIAFLTIFVLHSGTAFIWPKVVPFSKKTIQITCILFLAATVFFISVLTTDLVGLPYSEDPKSIAPKRLTVLHTERKKFIEAKIEASESGISIEDHDIREITKNLESKLPFYSERREITPVHCANSLYCGIGFEHPRLSSPKRIAWVPFSRPFISEAQELSLSLNALEDVGILRRAHFMVKGPSKMSLYISPPEGATIEKWTLSHTPPKATLKWNKSRSAFFVTLLRGKDGFKGNVKFSFSIDFLLLPMPEKRSGEVLNIAITGHSQYGTEMQNLEFRKWLDHFPKWTFPWAWTAQVQEHAFNLTRMPHSKF